MINIEKAVVKAPAASIYAEPSISAEMADEVLHGMSVEILLKIGEFNKIKTHYDYEGYIHNTYLSSQNPGLWDKEEKLVVSAANADVLSKANMKSPILTTLTKGGILAKRAIEGDFTLVHLADGRDGYIRNKFIEEPAKDFDYKNASVKEINGFREKLAESALFYMGTQYRWGGKTPWGIDCSGLCSMVYLLNGVVIYRDSSLKDGFPVKRISISNLSKGDLLFFPGHIALYLEDGRYIHSSIANDGVAINSLFSHHDDFNKKLSESIINCGSIFA